MTTGRTGTVFDCIRRIAIAHNCELNDGELLDRFIAVREEAAFVELVRRHGPMVLGVCRRVLANAHDAEDAFQATFLVLVRKADTVRPREQIGHWLYGVAFRTALKARAALRRRQEIEHDARAARRRDVDFPNECEEWRALLDRELTRLPEKFRAAVVLCDLEGLPRREAAKLLGLPEGTLSSRLATARVRLAQRLSRYGPFLSGGALAAVLAEEACAVAPQLLNSTGRVATLYAAGSGPVSASILTLTHGVLTSMWMTKLKLVPVVVFLIAAIAIGVAPVADSVWAGGPEDGKKPVANGAAQKEKKEQGASVHGTLSAIDAGKGTVTLTVQIATDKKQTEEKTFALAKDVKVILGDTLTKDKPPPEGKIADLTPETVIHAVLSTDGKAIVQVTAFGPGLHGGVKTVDAANSTITVNTKDKTGAVEKTLTVAKDAKILLSDGLDKKTPPKEGKLSDLVEGTAVQIRQSVDRKVALQIHVQGASIHGTLKGIDNGSNTITVSYKDTQIVEKTFKLAKGARLSGNLSAGATVTVQLSVFDKETATAVHAHDQK